MASCSPCQPNRQSAIRGKGWSLNRNRKNMNARVTSELDHCRDREGNEIIPDCKMTDRLHVLPGRDKWGEGAKNHDLSRVSGNFNRTVACQEAQRTDLGAFNSLTPSKANQAISRSVSFAYRNKESSPVLWERSESCLSLSSSTGKDLLPNSLNGNPCRDTWATAGVERYSSNNVPVILRNKRELRQSSNSASSADLIKRRSVEISQLRCALQEKVKAQQYRTYYLNSNYRKSWSDFPQTPENSRTRSRPKSVCGFVQADNYFDTERELLSSLEYRNNNRNNLRWACPQESSRVSSPPTLTNETRKLQYLVREPLSSPVRGQDLMVPYLCHRCSSPVGTKPEENYWSLCKEAEDESSRYCTPIGSPITKAPQRRIHYESPKPKTSENSSQST